MRFTPFGSGSILPIGISASLAEYANIAGYGILAETASYALTGSKGPDSDACDEAGPYEQYVPLPE
jgi:hypothetical protein